MDMNNTAVATHHLLERVAAYYDKPELTLVSRALEIATNAHLGRVRLAGNPHIDHCIAVADILLSWHAPAGIVAAGLLHDVLSEEYSTVPEITTIEDACGQSVAKIVGEIRRLRQFGYTFPRQAGAPLLDINMLTRMLPWVAISIQREPHAIIIRIADRLDNLRTIGYVSPEESETFLIGVARVFAPCADMLGMRAVRRALEDGAFEVRDPTRFAELRARYASNAQPQETDFLLDEFQQRFAAADLQVNVERSPESMYKLHMIELERGTLPPLAVAYPLLIQVDSEDQCYKALGIVHNTRPPVVGGFRDYIASPMRNGYRGLQTHVHYLGHQLAVLIRTRSMHIVAEYGIMAQWHGVPDSLLPDLGRWSAPAEGQILVFTPDSDQISLPEGATPIDFAYALHREIGHDCTRAIVNGIEVRLDEPLRTGDVVKIVTNREGLGPQNTWLDFVKTQNARYEIRRTLRARARAATAEAQLRGMKAIGEAIGETRLQTGVQRSLIPTSAELHIAAERMGYSKPAESAGRLLSDVGHGEVPPDSVILNLPTSTIQGSSYAQEFDSEGKRLEATSVARFAPVVLARCCRPLPSQSIISHYEKKPLRIVVHRANCGHVRGKPWAIPTEWEAVALMQSIELEILAANRIGLARDVCDVFAREKLDIVDLRTTVSYNGNAKILVRVRPLEKHDINLVMTRLNAIRGVSRTRLSTAPTPLPSNSDVLGHNNPYTFHPVSGKAFFGRGRELGKLEGKLANARAGEAILLWGPKRIGKTSLLLEMRRRLLADYRYLPVYKSLQGLADRTTTGLLHLLAETIEVDAANPFIHAPAFGRMRHDPLTYFAKFIESFQRYESRHLVLMLDEFQVLAGLDAKQVGIAEISAYLRSVSQQREGLSLIISGGGALDELLHYGELAALLSITHHQKLGCLAPPEAERLIRDPVPWVRYDDEAVQRLKEVTDSHPYYLQLLLQEAIARIDRPLERPAFRHADLEQLLVEWLPDQEEIYFSHLWGAHGGLDKRKTRFNMLVLAALALSSEINQWSAFDDIARVIKTVRSREAEVREALQYLASIDSVQVDSDDRWRIRLPLCHRWLRLRYSPKYLELEFSR